MLNITHTVSHMFFIMTVIKERERKREGHVGFGGLHIQGSLCMPNTTLTGINYMPRKYGAQYGHEQPVSSSVSKSPFNPQHTWCINKLWASGFQIWIWSVHGLIFSCSAVCFILSTELLKSKRLNWTFKTDSCCVWRWVRSEQCSIRSIVLARLCISTVCSGWNIY